jgi:hypothetical protein
MLGSPARVPGRPAPGPGSPSGHDLTHGGHEEELAGECLDLVGVQPARRADLLGPRTGHALSPSWPVNAERAAFASR